MSINEGGLSCDIVHEADGGCATPWCMYYKAPKKRMDVQLAEARTAFDDYLNWHAEQERRLEPMLGLYMGPAEEEPTA